MTFKRVGIILALSLVFAILEVAACSLFVHYVNPDAHLKHVEKYNKYCRSGRCRIRNVSNYVCHEEGKFCDAMKACKGSIIAGIFWSLLQIFLVLSGLCPTKKKWDEQVVRWGRIGVHAICCVVCIACFVNGLRYQDYYENVISIGSSAPDVDRESPSRHIPRIFIAASFFNALICPFVVGFIYCQKRAQKTNDVTPDTET